MRTRSVISAAVLLCGCALRHRTAAPEPARGPARDSLFQLDQGRGDLVATRGAVDGVLSVLAPNVVFLRAGAPAVYGRDGVRQSLAGGAPALAAAMTWEPLGGGVSYDLMSAYTYGVALRTVAPTSGPRLERYVAVWQRSRGAPWQIVAYSEVNSPATNEVTFTSNVMTPPLVAWPPTLRDAVASVRGADSLYADLSDRMGLGFASSSTIAPVGVLFGSPQLIVGSGCGSRLFRGTRGRNVAHMAAGVRVGRELT